MVKLKIPLKENDVRKLKVGDRVELTGILYTARDEAHRFFVRNKFKLNSNVIYHCGPIVKKVKGNWKIVAAGPTTSLREEPYEAKVIKDYKIRVIIGKGGMGDDTANALQKYGCVYLAAIGGAASLLAEKIVKVRNVFKKEFGMTEAIWELEVKDFPAIVAMDAHGNSIYKDIELASKNTANKLMR